MDVKVTRNWRARWPTALCAVLTCCVAQALWAADTRMKFNIPAGDFSQSIIEFYRQTQVEIMYASTGSVG